MDDVVLSDSVRPPPLSLRVLTPAAGMVRIEVGGEVDAMTAGQLKDAAQEALRRHVPHRLEVDLAGVGFLDSSGIHAFVELSHAAAEQSCQLVAVRPQRHVARVLQITGIAEYLGLPAAAGNGNGKRPALAERADGRA